jgi:plasmid stabilization system protein ParE
MGKNREIVWSLQAQIDFYNSLDYIKAVWNDQIAERFIEAIQHKVNLIEKFPLIGRKIKFPKRCRKVFIRPYHLLFYRVSINKVEIVRLFDGRQNPEQLKRK